MLLTIKGYRQLLYLDMLFDICATILLMSPIVGATNWYAVACLEELLSLSVTLNLFLMIIFYNTKSFLSKFVNM